MGLYSNQITDVNSHYNAFAYYRLSKDDGNTHESDSIANQRILVREYVRKHPNIELVGESFDDGYTGTNFNRPGFKEVISAINDGKANCVIVKDLSRLGREYVETGRYIEMVFPSKGVRFIAINDDVDSINSRSGDDILIPVKNIMNESYCRELSKKLRRQFRIQRANGEYLGAFACYGYLKDPNDKHKLIIDKYAAEIVQTIFLMKQKGYSQQAIADFLNSEDILPPAEYKRSQGLNYKSGLKGSHSAKWNHVTILNILKNPVYIGTLVQGKRGTPNYKIKQMRTRDEEQWSIIEANHEPIIDSCTFNSVQKILLRDTRATPNSDCVSPLSGMVFCADCNRSMIKKTTTRCGRKFIYYICSTHKKGEGCSSHSIPVELLEDIVLRAVKGHISLIIEMKELISEINNSDLLSTKIQSLDIQIAEKEMEIEKQKSFRMKLYEALSEGLIDRDEYEAMRNKTSASIEGGETAVRKLKSERHQMVTNGGKNLLWIEEFAKYESETKLTRELAVALIDKVTVSEDKSVHIDLNYKNEFEAYNELLKNISQEVS